MSNKWDSLTKDEVLSIYKEVLDGKSRKSFPNNFWLSEDAKLYTKWCVRYLLDDVLKWDRDTICLKYTHNTLKEYKLSYIVSNLIWSVYDILNLAYPDEFKPWELNQVGQNFWTKERSIETFKWLIEDKLNWTDDDIRNKLNTQVLKDYRLFGALIALYNGSVYAFLNTVYPDRFKCWELSSTPRNYWNKGTAVEATRWLIEVKLGFDEVMALKMVKHEDFKRNGLGFMIKKVYGGNMRKALKEAYPNKY